MTGQPSMESGILGRRAQSRERSVRRDKAIAMYQRGYVIPYIARVLGVTPRSVRRYIKSDA